MKKNMNKLLSYLPLKKIQKKITFLRRPNNTKKVLFLLGFLIILFLIHKFYLSKEGFASSADDFEETVDGQNSMVLFYADWCGHCKTFLPEWDQFSSSWNNDSQHDVKLMKVDCSKPSENKSQEALMKKYNIKGYPTILTFKDGQASEYNGKRDNASLTSYLNSF